MKRTLILAFLTLTINSTGQIPDYIPAEGLVAYYPFDRSLFDTRDSGTTGGPILRSCVANTPDAAAAEDCSLLTLQELSFGYLLQQGQLDLQDTLIIGLQQQVDSLNALLNNGLQND